MERLQVWGLLGLMVFTAAQNSTHSPAPGASYLLLTPRLLRPGFPISVCVTVLTHPSLNVSVHIRHNNETVASNSTTVQGGSTMLLTLPPMQDPSSAYRYPYTLVVTGHMDGTEVFSNSTQLDFDPKGFSTFIQTDKLNYRPGQHVKIRAVSVKPDTKPYDSPVDISIRDPRGNLLRQWLGMSSYLGVVSKEFQLSENPPLGEWTVITEVSGVSSEKRFNVALYVLPKFEVMIKVPDAIFHKDTLNGSVIAKYTYGKPVQGNLHITYVHHFHGLQDAYVSETKIDGRTDFQFDVPEYRPMTKRSLLVEYEGRDREDEFIMVMVSVTEPLTGLVYNSTTKVSLAKRRYKISFVGYPQVLRPSLNFTAMLKITTYNGQPLSLKDLDKKTVRVSVTQRVKSPWGSHMGEMDELFPRQPNMSKPPKPKTTPSRPKAMMSEDMEFPVPPNGIVPLFIQLQNDIKTLTIDAYFEDGSNTLQLYKSYSSPSHSYLQLHKPSNAAKVGSPLHLHVESNFLMTEIHYMVSSKGQVVSVGRSSGDLILVPEMSWSPLARVIVYCVHDNGEIVNDVIQIPISPALQNKVSLNWSDITRAPGDDVTLKVTTSEPGSLVGILVVDTATQLDGTHNDITEEMVLAEMAKYGISTADSYSDTITMGDPYTVFKTCDLKVLTDATLHKMDHMMMTMENPELFGDGLQFKEQQEEPRQRMNFPETWIWLDANMSTSNTKEISLTVPDSITSWVASAFVISPNRGLGLTEEKANLTVFQNFFLNMNLPLSVIRGEQFVLDITLFNYLPEDLEVKVIVAESEAFEFVSPDSEWHPGAGMRRVTVGSQTGASVLIPISPLVLGEIPISVKAISASASDHVRRTVLVKAEGLEQLFSSSLLLEVSASRPTQTRNISFTFPPDLVRGSQRVMVSAVGNLISPSTSGLSSLIRMPYGCGEQNMINFAPNIYVLKYLDSTEQNDQKTTDRAINNMKIGYEQQQSFQRADGSYSAFGDNDSSGSTWLSAFVLRCFLQARPYVSIDPRVLGAVASWLGAQQLQPEGSFREPGRVIHTELQGGLDGPVSLTAYVLIALLEDQTIRVRYGGRVATGLVFLEDGLSAGVSSSYSLSLVTYALALAGRPSANTALRQLMGRAVLTDGVPIWSLPDGPGLSASWQPRSADIEIASYVLLSQVRLRLVAEGLPLMKWLSQQRNPNGGFTSTQDTVVALQALTEFASLSGSGLTDYIITVRHGDSTDAVASFTVNQQNYLLLQSTRIEATEHLNLEVTAEGQGLCLFQLNVFYNVRSDELLRRKRDAHQHEAFHLDIKLIDHDINSMDLHICTSLVAGLDVNVTGMALMEVGLLSGFVLQSDGVKTGSVIKKVETPPGKVVLYLDSVTTEEFCVVIPLTMENKVAKVQEASVLIYDYYEPRRRTARMYNSAWRSSMSSCSFCGPDCSQCTTGDEDYELNSASSSRQNQILTTLSPALLIFITATVLGL